MLVHPETCDEVNRPIKKRRVPAQQKACQHRSRTASSLSRQGRQSYGPSYVDKAIPTSCESIRESRTANAHCVDRRCPLLAHGLRLEWDEALVAAEKKTKANDDVDYHGDSQERTMECQLQSNAEQAIRNPDPAHRGNGICVSDLPDDADQDRKRIDCTFLYPIGTRVRKHYDGYGWVTGAIVQFEGVYRVRYEDGDEEDFLDDDKELVDVVSQAKGNPKGSSFNGIILPVGTPVQKHFPGYGWFAGKIVAFDGIYLVRHDDGDEEELFYDSPDLAAIVGNAKD